MGYYDFTFMNIESTKNMLADTYDKKNPKGHDMLMRVRITRRVLSVLKLHPDWDESDVFNKVQKSFRNGECSEIKKKIDRELYDYFKANFLEIIKLEPIEDGKEFSHYAHHSNVKLSKEQWVKKARAKWGDVYDYTDSVYVAGLKPITIRCIKHDHYFTVQAGNHICTSNPRTLYMGGCPICSQERLEESRRIKHEEAEKRNAERNKNAKNNGPKESPQERFVRRAKEMYPDYDYSLVEYKGRDKPVTIICKEHGPFNISPRTLLNGAKGKPPHGCYKCCGLIDPSERMNIDMFKKKMKELYGDRFVFHFEDYKTCDSMIRFTCKDHGEQNMSVPTLLNGKGCKYCNGKFYPADWLKKARAVHGDKYEYDETRPPRKIADYIRYKCPEHDWQIARYDSHVVQGHGCKYCAGIYTNVPVEERKRIWVQKCKERFGNRFSYRNVEYINNDTPVKVFCKEHKYLFEVTPDTHVRGSGGCPYCSASEGESKIRKWLEDNNISFVPQYKVPNENASLPLLYLVPDFWLPDHNLFIEMNGQQHYEDIEYFRNRPLARSNRERGWSFETQQLRDATFRQYCKDHNHNLLEIKYDQIDRIPKILKRTLKKNSAK